MNQAGSVNELYLCLDQGGHSSRALVLDGQGQLHAQAQVPIATERDGPCVEHDAEQLVAGLLSVAEEALRQLGQGAARVAAAGLATQRSSIACWHSQTGAALAPVLSWQDTRAADWLAGFSPHWQRVHELTGLVLSPHYGVSKLKWCLEHLPAVADAEGDGVLRCGPLASFLAQRLTGNSVCYADPANGSRTLLWDRQSRGWSQELLQLFGMPEQCLPRASASRANWGTLRVAAHSVPLQVVTGDQSAALFAFGLPQSGVVYANLGTGAFMQRRSDDAAIDPGRLLASVVYQDARHSTTVIEGTVNGAGSALSSVAESLHVTREQLHANAADWLLTADNPPLFLNCVAGLGSPWWQSDLPSVFVPESRSRKPAESLAAVLESIAFLLTVNYAFLERLLGPADKVVATGGLTAVDPLMQVLANLTCARVERATVREATATGLAYLLAGLPRHWPQAEPDSVFLPTAAPELATRFERWQAHMPAIN